MNTNNFSTKATLLLHITKVSMKNCFFILLKLNCNKGELHLQLK